MRDRRQRACRSARASAPPRAPTGWAPRSRGAAGQSPAHGRSTAAAQRVCTASWEGACIWTQTPRGVPHRPPRSRSKLEIRALSLVPGGPVRHGRSAPCLRPWCHRAPAARRGRGWPWTWPPSPRRPPATRRPRGRGRRRRAQPCWRGRASLGCSALGSLAIWAQKEKTMELNGILTYQ